MIWNIIIINRKEGTLPLLTCWTLEEKVNYSKHLLPGVKEYKNK